MSFTAITKTRIHHNPRKRVPIFVPLLVLSFATWISSANGAGPFSDAKGNYQGLFYETAGVAFETSGFVSAKVTDRGAFSGKIEFMGSRYAGSGNFAPDGTYSNSIPRTGTSPLEVFLQIDMNGAGILTGHIGDGMRTAELTGNRAFYSKANTAPQTGRYTLVIPGTADSSMEPGGEGFATIKVNAAGKVLVKGRLADGTKLARKTFVAANGQFPLYKSLYSGRGSILGWLTFEDRLDDDLNGMLSWIRLPQAGARLYPGGFALTNGIEAVGSHYTATPGTAALAFTDGQLWLANGNLPQPITNSIVLGADNRITGTNDVKVKISASSGSFKGKVTDPSTAQAISIKGVVLQKRNHAAGYFIGTDQSGRVFVGE